MSVFEAIVLIWMSYLAGGAPVVENATRVAVQAANREWTEFIWLALAALAGAMTTLSFRQFRPFTARERAMMVFVGFVFAIFVGPLIVDLVLPQASSSSSAVGALYYIIAAGAHWLLPWIIEKIFGFKTGAGNGPSDGSNKDGGQ